MELDTDKTLSEQDKLANYKMLMDALSEKNPSAAWIEKHRDFIIRTRDFFTSFNHILIISDDPAVIAELSENRRRCELLVGNLISSISSTGKYDLVVYRLFVQNLEPLVRQYVHEDDLAELLGKMQM
jgi:hypothetical protein